LRPLALAVLCQDARRLTIHHTHDFDLVVLTLARLFVEGLPRLTWLLELGVANAVTHVFHDEVRWTHLSALGLLNAATSVDPVEG
jgi:hypothetical protein